MRSFLDKYLPLYQAPDAPSGGAPAPSSDAGSTSPSPASPSDGGSTTPASPSSTDLGPAEGTSNDFSYIFGGEAETTETPPSGLPQTETPPAPKPPEAPKPASAEPAQATVPPQAPAQSTPAPAAPASTEATSAPQAQLDPYDPGALATALQQNEAAAIQHIADTMFKLSPEEIEALETDTVGTVPKLLAKALVMSQRNTLNTIARLLPTMMQRQTAVTAKHSENEGKFYAAWPQIEKAKHGDLVNRLGAQYRQMNPNASLDQMIAELGPYIMMVAKIDPNARPGTQTAQPSPMAPTGYRPPQPAPFVPAGPHSGGASPQQPPTLHPVEVMFGPPPE